MDIRDDLNSMAIYLAHATEMARALPNQNIADILHSAAAKIVQAIGHPDAEKLNELRRAAAAASEQLEQSFPGTHPATE